MTTNNEFIFIKTGTTIDKVLLSDIYAIESEGNYCTVKTNSQEYVQRSSLIKMKDKLNEQGFIQVNKSTLLPVHRIDHVNLTVNQIAISNHQYTLSRNFRKDFIETLDLL